MKRPPWIPTLLALATLTISLPLALRGSQTQALPDRKDIFEGKFFGVDVMFSPGVMRATDLDGDGNDDLVSAFGGDVPFRIHFGNNDRTFDPPVSYNAPNATFVFTSILLLVDVTGDQILDVVYGGPHTAPSDSVHVAPGTGGGNFASPIGSDVIGGDISDFGVGDFDEDLNLDLAVVDAAEGLVRILLGDGTGSFSLFAQFSAGQLPAHIAVDELNGDGHLDLVITDPPQSLVRLFQGSGNGVFFPMTTLNTSSEIEGLAVEDLGNNGSKDVLVATNDLVEVFLGYDNGFFDPPIQYAMGGQPRSITVADLDGDMWPDLLTSNANLISVRYGTGSATFGPNADFYSGTLGPVAPGDFDGDSVIDLAAPSAASINLLLGNGDRTFGLQDIDYGTGDKPFQVIANDLGGGTALDLIVANSGTNTIRVLPGNGDGTFDPGLDYAVGPNPASVAAGDFDGDLATDVVSANSGKTFEFCGPGGGVNCCDPLIGICVPVTTVQSMMVSVLDGNGDATLQDDREDFLVGANPQWVTAIDLDNDQVLDLVVANTPDRNVSVLLGVGDGTFSPKVDYLTGFDPVAIDVADLDNDTNLDLVVANALSASVSVLMGNGDGTFGVRVDYEATLTPRSVSIAEVTGDAFPDLVVGGFPTVLLQGNGNGTFMMPVDLGVDGYAAAGDLDTDGLTDLAVVEPGRNGVSTLYGAGDGTFPERYLYGTGNVPLTVTIADVSGDGRPDLLVPNFNDDDVTVLVARDVVTGIAGVRTPPSAVLLQSRPIPARQRSVIGFSLDAGSEVTLRVFDAHGRRVRTLSDGFMPSGRHEIEWDLKSDTGGRVPSGVYFYELRGSFGREARRIVVTR